MRVLTELRFWWRWNVMQPIRCRTNRHDVSDVVEKDGSVGRGMCLYCLADTPPVRPRPADPEYGAWLDEMRALAIRHLNESTE